MQKVYILTFCISCMSKLFQKMVRISEDFIWYGKEFQTFGPSYLKLFVPSLT